MSRKLMFQVLLKTFVDDLMPPWYPISAPNIKSLLNYRGIEISLYMVRKILNYWREKGFVVVETYKVHDEYENWPPLKGWKMIKGNDIYDYLIRRDDRIAREIFGN